MRPYLCINVVQWSFKDDDGKFTCKNVSPLDPSNPPKWNSQVPGDHTLVWRDIDDCEANSEKQV